MHYSLVISLRDGYLCVKGRTGEGRREEGVAKKLFCLVDKESEEPNLQVGQPAYL